MEYSKIVCHIKRNESGEIIGRQFEWDGENPLCLVSKALADDVGIRRYMHCGYVIAGGFVLEVLGDSPHDALVCRRSSAPVQFQNLATRLLESYSIGEFSKFMDEPAEFETELRDSLAHNLFLFWLEETDAAVETMLNGDPSSEKPIGFLRA
jgi:hypothetical protein